MPQNPVHQRFPNKMQFCGINIFLLFLAHPHGYYQLTNVPRYQPGCTHKYWGSKFLSFSAMTAPCRNWRPWLSGRWDPWNWVLDYWGNRYRWKSKLESRVFIDNILGLNMTEPSKNIVRNSEPLFWNGLEHFTHYMEGNRLKYGSFVPPAFFARKSL